MVDGNAPGGKQEALMLVVHVLVTAAALVTVAAPSTRDSSGSWLIGCWEGPGNHRERWIAGDHHTLFGARWTVRGAQVDVKVMRLAFSESKWSLDVVSLPGRVTSYSVRLDEGIIRAQDGSIEWQYSRFSRRACEAAGFRGEVVLPDLVRLHNADMNAVMRSDSDALVNLWSDEIVSLMPGRAPVVGKGANEQIMRASVAAGRAISQPVDYELLFDTVVMAGKYAIEWGAYRGVARMVSTGNEISYCGAMLRVASRETGGGYRIAATMFTAK